MTSQCPVCHRGWCKHGVHVSDLVSCPHCAEDAKILEEKIEAVVDAVQAVAAEEGGDVLGLGTSDLRAALTDLVREVRRG